MRNITALVLFTTYLNLHIVIIEIFLAIRINGIVKKDFVFDYNADFGQKGSDLYSIQRSESGQKLGKNPFAKSDKIQV